VRRGKSASARALNSSKQFEIRGNKKPAPNSVRAFS
jgi:hypothetical protein